MKNRRYNLPQIIFIDLMHHGKVPLLLLIAILISALLVVIITYQTRLYTVHREKLFLERQILDTEWRNLILEENALIYHHQMSITTMKEK
ncbi:Cell division protein FtsL [Candidatus Erwinia haradaeae]|uniref:Cell division protein FtsL n=1 Tax=Candidatus Erwinia haradaeae TaxID=1922217 RepID=A0A451DCF2_9GAMM|nr:cell division protein FtsL [Candidatus Erwinia haradaeae]VFP84114.1 Cell division protein FtsL [Candidatus Erwinia haradaeae]